MKIRVVPCGLTDGRTDRQTDMVKRIVTFRHFAHAPNSSVFCPHTHCIYVFWMDLNKQRLF